MICVSMFVFIDCLLSGKSQYVEYIYGNNDILSSDDSILMVSYKQIIYPYLPKYAQIAQLTTIHLKLTHPS
jgi:hypothetical protein